MRQNNHLQQQAQAYFVHRFIKSQDAQSWQLGTFHDLINAVVAGDWGKESPTGNNSEKVYCIRGADIPEVRNGNMGKMPVRYILPKNYITKKLVPGDIVVEISGGSPTQSTGRCAVITKSLLDRYNSGMVCTNFCKAIKPIAGYSMFIYHYWNYLYNAKVFFSYENGTTGIKNLDIAGILETEAIRIPPLKIAMDFEKFCETLFSSIYANALESEQLANIRDTLLPRLMSGELDVSDLDL